MDKIFIEKQTSSYPEWFRLGKDASKIIDKLDKMKDLEFYLKHPEPFIRLLTMRRLSILLLPDAIPFLEKVMDDPIENKQNIDEAAWTLSRIVHYKGITWFRNNEKTKQYKGTEAPSERYLLTVINDDSAAPEIRQNMAEAAIWQDETLLRLQLDENKISIKFSVLPWFISNLRYLLIEMFKGILFIGKTIALSLYHVVFDVTKNLVIILKNRNAERKKSSIVKKNPITTIDPSTTVQKVSKTIPVMIGAETNREFRQINNMDISQKEFVPLPKNEIPVFSNPQSVYNNMMITDKKAAQFSRSQFSSLSHSPRGSSSWKKRKGGHDMFKLLFYPVRMVKQHIIFTIIVFIAFYSLLAFQHNGREFVYKINPSALHANDKIIASARASFQHFFDISNDHSTSESDSNIQTNNSMNQEIITDPSLAISPNTELVSSEESNTQLAYEVIAPKGLNLRKDPSATGEKMIWMPVHAEVLVTNMKETDNNGDEWFTVNYKGQTGWALAKWMEPLVPISQSGEQYE